MKSAKVFICGGKPTDHVCDNDGPQVCGGEDENGNHFEVPATPENRQRKGIRWGSVTCSKCGSTNMERSMWEDF